jgi:hypothetical protein
MNGDNQLVIEDVTVVTGNERTALLELILYAGFLYCITHPAQVERGIEKLRSWRDRLIKQVEIWQTVGAINTLPETDEPCP